MDTICSLEKSTISFEPTFIGPDVEREIVIVDKTPAVSTSLTSSKSLNSTGTMT